jgi:hypothetical protein
MNGYILARALVVCTGFIWVGPIQFCCIVLHPPFLLSFYTYTCLVALRLDLA